MKICLLTTGQPSTNPRLVKEADALIEAGHGVRVIASYWTHWAEKTDQVLLASRKWPCRYVGGSPTRDWLQYRLTRFRHSLSRRISRFLTNGFIPRDWALCRVSPELEREAVRIPADLYIAHNLGALPPAVAAARKHRACVGFDAEDFHGDEYFEKYYLPQCDYVTASSPEIAEAYAEKYKIQRPVPILNVFPLDSRPDSFRSFKEESPLTLYWFSQTIGPNRGLEDILQAMGALEDYPIQLHLRGGWQNGYQEKFYKLARFSGVSERRIFSCGPEVPDEMVRLASNYDIGLALEQPYSEKKDLCLTNKIFTYLLAGNAVIGTATKGQRPILECIGKAAFCYPPGKIAPLVNQLKYWFENRKVLEQARRQAWDWGTSRYNWDIEKERFLQVVDHVLNPS